MGQPFLAVRPKFPPTSFCLNGTFLPSYTPSKLPAKESASGGTANSGCALTTPHFVAQPILAVLLRPRTLWHSHFWLCSYDPAQLGDPAPRRTEASKYAENVLASATIAPPSRNLVASSSEAPQPRHSSAYAQVDQDCAACPDNKFCSMLSAVTNRLGSGVNDSGITGSRS